MPFRYTVYPSAPIVASECEFIAEEPAEETVDETPLELPSGKIRCHRHGISHALEIGGGRGVNTRRYCLECFTSFLSEAGIRNHAAPLANEDGDEEYVY